MRYFQITLSTTVLRDRHRAENDAKLQVTALSIIHQLWFSCETRYIMKREKEHRMIRYLCGKRPKRGHSDGNCCLATDISNLGTVAEL